MDVLSEVLKAVKLDGAVFFHGEFAAPWCAQEPDAETMASYLPTQPATSSFFICCWKDGAIFASGTRTARCR